MAQEIIDNGTYEGDQSAESVFNAFEKVNSNFTENYTDIEQLKTDVQSAVSGFQGELKTADTPANNGYYFPSESGTYSNAGNLVVDLSTGLNIITKDGSNYELITYPISLADYVSKTNDVESGIVSGSNKLATSGDVKTYFDENKNYSSLVLDASYSSLSEAIAAVPNEYRKKGLTLTYNDLKNGNNAVSYKYRSVSTGSWEVPTSWIRISDSLVLDDVHKQNRVLKFINASSRTEYKDSTIFNTTSDLAIVLDLVFTDLSNPNTTYILSKGLASDGGNGFIVSLTNNIFTVNFNGVIVSHDLSITGTLDRFVFTKVGLDIKLYYNGVLVDENTSTYTLEVNNAYKLQFGKWSYNQAGENLNIGIKQIGTSYDVDYILSVLDVNSVLNLDDLETLLASYNLTYLTSTFVTLDVKGNDIQTYKFDSNLNNDYLDVVYPVKNLNIYDTFEKMYTSFPKTASVGNYKVNRNTDVKSGDYTKDYDLENVEYDDLNKILTSPNVLSIDKPVMTVDMDGNMYSVENQSVFKCTEVGGAWVEIGTVATLNNLSFCYYLNDGALLILEDTYRDDSNLANDRIGGIWKYDLSDNTSTKALNHTNRYITFQPSWCIEIVGNVVYFSQYGNSYNTSSYDPAWDKGVKADAVRIYKSEDYGATFTQLINLDTLTDLFPNDGYLHIHSVHYDTHWDRLWVTTGDGGASAKSNKKIIWTDNEIDWSGIELSNYYGEGFDGNLYTPFENLQGLSMWSNDKYVIIGADCYDNSIFRISKKDRNNIVLENAYEMSPINDDIVYFTGRMKKFTGYPVFIPLGRGDAATTNAQNNQKPRLVATYDGVNYLDIWKDDTIDRLSDWYFQVFKIKNDLYIGYRVSGLNYLIKMFKE